MANSRSLGVNQGAPLDWKKVKTHEPLSDKEWYGLAPEAHLDQQIRLAISGPGSDLRDEEDHHC